MSKKKQEKAQPKILNFVDALHLAKLLETSTLATIDISMEGMEVLLSKLHPMVFLEIIKLLTKKDIEEIKNLYGEQALGILFSGLYLNRANELLHFSRSEGIINVV